MSTLKVNNVTDLGDDAVITDGALVGAGKILQVVQGTFATTESTTSATFQNTSLTVSITPSSTSSKVYVICAVSTRTLRTGEANSGNSDFAIDRNGGTLVAQGRLSNVAQGSANYSLDTVTTLSALDSPSSASSVTYTWQHRTETGTTTVTSFLGNRTGFLIAMEVAG